MTTITDGRLRPYILLGLKDLEGLDKKEVFDFIQRVVDAARMGKIRLYLPEYQQEVKWNIAYKGGVLSLTLAVRTVNKYMRVEYKK